MRQRLGQGSQRDHLGLSIPIRSRNSRTIVGQKARRATKLTNRNKAAIKDMTGKFRASRATNQLATRFPAINKNLTIQPMSASSLRSTSRRTRRSWARNIPEDQRHGGSIEFIFEPRNLSRQSVRQYTLIAVPLHTIEGSLRQDQIERPWSIQLTLISPLAPRRLAANCKDAMPSDSLE